MEDNKTNPLNDGDEISLKELIIKTKNAYLYLKSKWKVVLICSLLGGLLGLAYSFLIKPKYTATCSFVLEDGSKTGLLSQYAGLASMAGIDLGGGGGGVFQGDNIIELYKSRTMLEKTLLCKANFNGKPQILLERYINFNNLREKWEKKGIQNISFTGNPENFNRKQDSIITDIVDVFNKKLLTVAKPDKKLSIINVSIVSEDELFAQLFTVRLVENVNTFFIQTKTKKTAQNVNILKRQVDSVKAVLNGSISGVANAVDATPNANPTLLTLRVPSQKKQVDVQASTAIYGEMVKNLELSKISLLQETPLIQIIDKPVLPLDETKVGKLKGIVIGSILGFFVSVVFVATKKVAQLILA